MPRKESIVLYCRVLPVILALFCYFFSLYIVFPFLPFMTKHFIDRPRSELGYFVGFLGSAFSLGDFAGSIVWGHLADRKGRRPVMLIMPAMTTIVILLFGCSQTFYWAVIARFAWGFSASQVGVSKTLLSELSTETSQARVFSFIGVANGVARLGAPTLGGLLYRPATKYPGSAVDVELFRKLPFLLPCLVAMALNLIVLITNFLFLKETLVKADRQNDSDSRGHDETTALTCDSSVGVSEEEGKERTTRQQQAAPGDKLQAANCQSAMSIFPSGFDTPTETHPIDILHLRQAPESPILSNGSAPHYEGTLNSLDCEGDLVELLSRQPNGQVRGQRPVLFRRTKYRGYKRGSGLSDTVDALTTSRQSKQGCFEHVKSYFRSYALLKQPVIRRSIMCYAVLAVIGIINVEVMPLLMLNDSKHGGFCFNEAQIGIVMGFIGIFQLIIQLGFYPAIAKRLGVRWFYRATLAVYACTNIMLPWTVDIVGPNDPLVLPSPVVQLNITPVFTPPDLYSNTTAALPSSASFSDERTSSTGKRTFLQVRNRTWLEESNSTNQQMNFWKFTQLTLSSSSSHQTLINPPSLPADINTLSSTSDSHGQMVNLSLSQKNSLQRAQDSCAVYVDADRINSTTSACGKTPDDDSSEDADSTSFSRVSCVPLRVWASLVGIGISATVPLIMAFTSVNIMVNNSCPMEIRGRVNGVGQSLAATGRAISPYVAVVFALTSTEAGPYPFNYHFTFGLSSALAVLCITVNMKLPKSIERRPSATSHNSQSSEGAELLVDRLKDVEGEVESEV